MKRMELKLWMKVVIGVALLGIMILWVSGSFYKRVEPGVREVSRGRPLEPDVALVTITNTWVETLVDLPGTVASERTIHLSARISAYVKDVAVSAGQRVEAGQRLIDLDDRELREQLAAAEAQFAQAETEHTRARELLEQQAGTQQAYDQARSRYLSAQAAVEQVRVMLSYSRIDSPIEGVVTERRVEVGDLANPGQLLAAVYDPRRMRLEVPVPGRLIDQLAKGREVDVELVRNAQVIKGRVDEIVSQVDPATRTQLVKILLETSGRELLPGTYGRLLLPLDPHEALLVPAAAVWTAGQLEFVEEVRDGRAVRVLVRTGPRHGEAVELLSGLRHGAQIVAVAGEGQ